MPWRQCTLGRPDAVRAYEEGLPEGLVTGKGKVMKAKGKGKEEAAPNAPVSLLENWQKAALVVDEEDAPSVDDDRDREGQVDAEGASRPAQGPVGDVNRNTPPNAGLDQEPVCGASADLGPCT
eukprot:jgi/Mesvir1/6960/Mv09107-RA.1